MIPPANLGDRDINIRECYELAKAAKEQKVLTQMGNQGFCSEGIRRACEYIWAGAVGNVLEAHAILGRNFGGSDGRPPSKPVPPSLHWDEWLGPAPYRDYHDGLHTFSWRSWRQFGTGTIGDMACHNLSTLWWALKIGEVKRFTVECLATKGGSEEMYPQDNVIRWEIPARGNMPPVKVYCYDHDGTGKNSAAGARRADSGSVLGHEERRHALLQLCGCRRPAHRVRPDRPLGDVRGRGQEARMGCRKDAGHEPARTQPIRPPRVPQGLGSLATLTVVFPQAVAHAEVPSEDSSISTAVLSSGERGG
jgi:Oxidoreductase family, C-terminal alpha/beta domain